MAVTVAVSVTVTVTVEARRAAVVVQTLAGVMVEVRTEAVTPPAIVLIQPPVQAALPRSTVPLTVGARTRTKRLLPAPASKDTTATGPQDHSPRLTRRWCVLDGFKAHVSKSSAKTAETSVTIITNL